MNGWYKILKDESEVPSFDMIFFHEGATLDGSNTLENYELEGFIVNGPCFVFTEEELNLIIALHLDVDRELIFQTIKEVGEREMVE